MQDSHQNSRPLPASASEEIIRFLRSRNPNLNMATSLPYDIVGRIIDILAAEGDLAPVKNASLTSSSVLHLCRRHIFRTISYGSSFHRSCLPKLLVNRDNSAIVQHIKNLHLSLYNPNNPLLVSPLLPNFLHTIPHLECLRISGYVDWTEIDPLLRSALLHLMHLPTLTHLGFSGIRNIPISALAPCANLKQLDIDCTTLAPFEDQSHSLRMSCSKTPRILRFKTTESKTAVERLLRAKWEDGGPVLDFTHIDNIQLDSDAFHDVQLTQEP